MDDLAHFPAENTQLGADRTVVGLIERQIQGVLHDPQNGQWGDCMRTCLAMILGVDRDTVPHFNRELEAGEQDRLFREWLGARGMGLMAFGYAVSAEYVAEAMRVWNPGSAYMLSGRSPRGTQHIVVVAPDGKILDPHPDNGGLIAPDHDGIWWVYVVTAAPSVSAGMEPLQGRNEQKAPEHKEAGEDE